MTKPLPHRPGRGNKPIHGHTAGGRTSPTFNSWRGMIERCRPGKPYGLLGIRICDRWLMFANFLADMGERPNGHTIDRIECTGNYEPSNCQWTPRRRNCQQRRTTKLTEETRMLIVEMRSKGETRQQIADQLGVSISCIKGFLSGESWRDE